MRHLLHLHLTLFVVGCSSDGEPSTVSQATVESWARAVCFDEKAELRGELDSVYVQSMPCAAGSVLAADGAGVWACADPVDLAPSAAIVNSLTALEADVSALQSAAPFVGTLPNLPGASCLDIKTKFSDAPSGIYWVDLDAGSRANAFQVYCDMIQDGGGWTLVQQGVPVANGEVHLCQSGAVGSLDLSAASVAGPAKLSDANINALWSTMREVMIHYDQQNVTPGSARYEKICKLDFKSTFAWNTTFNASSVTDLDTTTVTCFVGSMPSITGALSDVNLCGFGFTAGTEYVIQSFGNAYNGNCNGPTHAGAAWLGPGNNGCNMTKTFVR